MNMHETNNAVINFLGLNGRQLTKLALQLEAGQPPKLTTTEYFDLPHSDRVTTQEFEFFLKEKMSDAETHFVLERECGDISKELRNDICLNAEEASAIIKAAFSDARRRLKTSRQEWRSQRVREAIESEQEGRINDAVNARYYDNANWPKI